MVRWLSASELAAAKLNGVPQSRENAARFIARIISQSPELVRPRPGRGGGLEVSELALPDAARDALKAQSTVAQIRPSDAQELADALESDKRQIATIAMGSLTARQRRVMEARQTILLAIEAQAISTGCGKDNAIRQMVAAAGAQTLDPSQVEIICVANDRTGKRSASLSRATIYEWFRLREKDGPAGLSPDKALQKRQEKRGLPGWFDGFLQIYGRPTKPSVEQALREFIQSLAPEAPKPTVKQARYWLKKMPQLEKLKGREGKLALRARLAYTARDFSDLLPTSVYVADGKTFDAEIAHPIHGQPFRPELTTILDVATRKIVGWSAALDENTFAVVDALRCASATHGIPAIFYTDRGPGYRNKAMDAPLTGFMARAGITPMRALPYNSQAKGVVERLNQVYTAAAKSLPTYIGRDMDKEARLLVFKTRRRDIALTGQSRFLTGWDAFLGHIEQTLAAYNDRPHSSLPKVFDRQLSRNRHMTPNEMWALKCEAFDPIIPDEAELNDMFRPYVVRRTRRALVDWLDNSYFAKELEPYHGKDVVVGYDIRDASKVWVREIEEIDNERIPGRLIAVAIFEGHKTRYVPVSAERAAMERRAKGRLGRLQRKIDVVEQELRPAAFVELSPVTTLATVSLAGEPVTHIAPSGIVADPIPAIPDSGQARRPVFRDDCEFASWIVENPDRATASDKELVRDLLTTHSSNELLRMSGVDLDALRKLARSAA